MLFFASRYSTQKRSPVAQRALYCSAHCCPRCHVRIKIKSKNKTGHRRAKGIALYSATYQKLNLKMLQIRADVVLVPAVRTCCAGARSAFDLYRCPPGPDGPCPLRRHRPHPHDTASRPDAIGVHLFPPTVRTATARIPIRLQLFPPPVRTAAARIPIRVQLFPPLVRTTTARIRSTPRLAPMPSAHKSFSRPCAPPPPASARHRASLRCHRRTNLSPACAHRHRPHPHDTAPRPDVIRVQIFLPPVRTATAAGVRRPPLACPRCPDSTYPPAPAARALPKTPKGQPECREVCHRRL